METSATIAAGDLQAAFWPGRGMVGVSLRHKGAEILRRIDDLETAAVKGSTAGIPLLYPWANRLAGPHYQFSDQDVKLDLKSPLVHLDSQGLPMHGATWAMLNWDIIDAQPHRLLARLEWNRGDLLKLFPFHHYLELSATIEANRLTIETTVTAGPYGPVPISFGFHPYFGIPNLPRSQWHLQLPAMRKWLLDSKGIPTGEDVPFDGYDGPLGTTAFDDGFSVIGMPPTFSLAGAGRKITVTFDDGYRHAQIFAPRDKDFIAIEPMTAPTNALISGRGLQSVAAAGQFQAAFSIEIESTA